MSSRLAPWLRLGHLGLCSLSELAGDIPPHAPPTWGNGVAAGYTRELHPQVNKAGMGEGALLLGGEGPQAIPLLWLTPFPALLMTSRS